MEYILESACVFDREADRLHPVEKTDQLEGYHQPQKVHGSVALQPRHLLLHQGKLAGMPVHIAYSTSEYDAVKAFIPRSPQDHNKAA